MSSQYQADFWTAIFVAAIRAGKSAEHAEREAHVALVRLKEAFAEGRFDGK